MLRYATLLLVAVLLAMRPPAAPANTTHLFVTRLGVGPSRPAGWNSSAIPMLRRRRPEEDGIPPEEPDPVT